MSKLVISLLVFLLSFGSFYCETTDYEYTLFSMGDTLTDPNLLDQEELIGQIASDYFALKSKNNDVVGWINVPNVCYYPVMYTGDQYYLRRDVNGNYNYAGTLFMNKHNKGSFKDSALIYGHHMRNGLMFGSLPQYEHEAFFQNNECIEVFDGENLYYYKPYTTLFIQDGKEFITQTGWVNDDERAAYFESLYKRSIVKMEEGLEPDFYQPMLFLQTCEYNFYNSREVVGCYLVKTVPYNK